MSLIRLPLRFFQDHCDRFGEKTPAVAKATKSAVWVDAADPYLPALKADAEYYADTAAQDHDFGARALLRALQF